MAVDQGSLQFGRNFLTEGVSIETTHRFGDQRAPEIAQGQIWRALTSTAVHYSILHLALNVLAMYQLGRLVESWYGSWEMIALYAVIGLAGNVLSALLKLRFSPSAAIPSAGGSEVICGLIGLIAVVGWRMKNRFGNFLRNRMLWILVLTGVLGIFLPFDNYGHFSGAGVGALIGLAHPYLERVARRRSARLAGVLGALVLVAALGAQVNKARAEARFEAEVRVRIARLEHAQQEIDALGQVVLTYRNFAQSRHLVPLIFRQAGSPFLPAPFPAELVAPRTDQAGYFRATLRASLERLDALKPATAEGPTAEAYRRWRNLARAALRLRPRSLDQGEFYTASAGLIQRARAERDAAERELRTFARPLQVARAPVAAPGQPTGPLGKRAPGR